MTIFQILAATVALAAVTSAGFPAVANPATTDPSGHPVPEIYVNVEDGNKQISIQIGCEGQSHNFQYAAPNSGTVQKNFQLGPSNTNIQIASGFGNIQHNRQKTIPKGGWNCP